VTAVVPSPVDRFRSNISTCDADGPVSLLQTRLNTTTLPKALQRAPMLTLSRRDAPPEARTKTIATLELQRSHLGGAAGPSVTGQQPLPTDPADCPKPRQSVRTYEVHPYLFLSPAQEGKGLARWGSAPPKLETGSNSLSQGCCAGGSLPYPGYF
jgi:hypothetical protein